jgi:hypothetical protein
MVTPVPFFVGMICRCFWVEVGDLFVTYRMMVVIVLKRYWTRMLATCIAYAANSHLIRPNALPLGFSDKGGGAH